MKMDVSQAEFKRIPVNQIRRYANQPRKYISQEFLAELTSTTKIVGQPTPIIVKPLDPPIDGCLYELIDGEQRWRACGKAGIVEISAMVVKVKNENEQFLLSVITNVQKSTLTPMELAYSIERLQSMEMSQREIGKLLGKSQGWVQVSHCLLTLAPETLALAGPETPEERRLSRMQAYLLVGLPEKNQISLARAISSQQLSVTDARRLVAGTVRDENIILAHKNTSRLRMIEDLKIFRNFFTRTDNYLESFNSMDDKKFQRMFRGDVNEILRLKTMARQIAEKAKTLEESLQRAGDLLVSKSTYVEPTNGSDNNSEQPEKRNYAGQPCSWGTVKLLKKLGLPRQMLYGPERNGKHRSPKHNSFWQRKINHLDILGTAKEAYRAKVKLEHPDMGGSCAETAILNVVWETIEKRFSLHGFNLG